MATQIERDQETILKFLYIRDEESGGAAYVGRAELASTTNLPPGRVNHAVQLLRLAGLIERIQSLGTFPYDFDSVKITARGKYEVQKRELNEKTQRRGTTDMPNHAMGNQQWDLFICHASEDKEEIVRPLVNALLDEGYNIWYDEFELKLGVSLRRSIDKGLAQSKYGLVILSPSFFAKEWPQKELDGLAAKERDGRKVVLPVWHKVDRKYILDFSPTLADLKAAKTSEGVKSVVEEVKKVVRPSHNEGKIEFIEQVQAYLFFPKDTPKEQRNLDFHNGHFRHRLIVNFKTNPPKAYYLTTGSYGWKFIEKYPDRWVSEVVDSDDYSIDDPKFTSMWCVEKKFLLIPRVAERKDLIEKS